MGKTYKDNPNKFRKHSDNKPRKNKGNRPKFYEQDFSQNESIDLPPMGGIKDDSEW